MNPLESGGPEKSSLFKKVVVAAGLSLGALGSHQEALAQKQTSAEPTEILNEAHTYITQSPHFSKYPKSVLSWTAAFEKPTDYQAQQMLATEERIRQSLPAHSFKNKMEMLQYINKQIDSNFNSANTTLSMKDAFAEKEGENPKGTFDCDSRSAMIEAILQGTGSSDKDVLMCATQGHMLLAVQSENAFFETTTNEPTTLSEEQKLQIDTLNTFPKFYAYLLANKAVTTAIGASGNIFTGKPGDNVQMENAVSMLQQANFLDPENVTTNLNLITMLSKSEDPEHIALATQAHQKLLANLTMKYQQAHPETGMSVGLQETHASTPENASSPLIAAVEGSEYIKNQFSEAADFMYYKAGAYGQSAAMYKELAHVASKNKTQNTEHIYLNSMMNAHFNNKDFVTYLREYDKVTKTMAESHSTYAQPELKKLSAQKHVAELLTGKLVIDSKNFDQMKA